MTLVMLMVLLELAHDRLESENLDPEIGDAIDKLIECGCVESLDNLNITDLGHQAMAYAVKKAEEVL